ncbi:MAG TPA: hypothetical protein VNY52_11525 [Solirubrobacteraceae bacterium]|jgi:hypothetical protein|nr:hypothetical protein [Solirubrobacteraceae bacterium]
MRATHTRSRRPIAVVALAMLLAMGATTMTASATAPVPSIDGNYLFTTITCVKAPCEAAPAPPLNDNYLSSLNINQPGTPLNRTETLRDERNTAAATVQSDIFNPTSHGGPPELTGCNGVGEGKTIWYDFYPNANGLVRIRTSADFGTIMAVTPFDPKTLLPENSQRHCAVNQPTAAGELFANVQAGKSYTIQIGGAQEAGGNIEFLFDYLVPRKRLQAEATLAAQPLAGGVRVVSLSVAAPRKARVEVRCTRGCRPQATTARTVRFPRLGGAVLPDGAALKIYVTAKNQIGAYIEYRVGHGSFTKIQRCLAPDSKRPKRCE